MRFLQRITAILSGRIGLGILVSALFATSLFMLLWTSPDSGEGGTSSWLVALLLVLLVVVGIGSVLLRFAGADYESPELARSTLQEPAARALLTRWLRRSRYYRFMGGVLGFIVGLPFEHSPVFSALAGVAVGGALAEIHVLRRTRRSAPVADLSVRSLRDYVNTVDVLAMAAIASGAVAVIVARLAGYGVANSARIAMVTLIVLVCVVGLQRLVAMRPRPALSRELRQADDLLRFLASTQGFTRPAIAVSFFMLSAAVSNGDTQGSPGGISVILVLLGLVWWYRGRHGRIPELAQKALAS